MGQQYNKVENAAVANPISPKKVKSKGAAAPANQGEKAGKSRRKGRSKRLVLPPEEVRFLLVDAHSAIFMARIARAAPAQHGSCAPSSSSVSPYGMPPGFAWLPSSMAKRRHTQEKLPGGIQIF
jgi:hypothetical protein